jgi:FkbM family methyltransferase
VVRTVKRWIEALGERAGYLVVPAWRLDKLEQARHLRDLLERQRISCVLDVGANIGQFAEFLRLQVGYTGRIVSFEPVGEMFTRIESLSAVDPSWDVYRVALGDSDGAASMNVFAERTLSSLLPRDELALRQMGYEKYLRETELTRVEDVPVRRLDSIFESVIAGCDRVFMKCDTQGYDMHVVRGARGILERIAAMQVELSIRPVYQGAATYLDSLAELASLGLEVTALFPVQRDRALRVVNLDCVLLNPRAAV